MADYLTSHASAFADRLAVIDDRPDQDPVVWTFGELNRQANRLAHVLVDLGVVHGTKVVTVGQNSAGWLRMVHAARKVGATAVPLNYRLAADEASYVIDNCDAEVVYVDAEFAAFIDSMRADIPKVRHVLVFDGEPVCDQLDGDALLRQASVHEPIVPNAEQAAATMIYTSGTTGKPKGALRQTAARPEQGAGLLQVLKWSPTDVYITTGPLYHSGPGGFASTAATLGNTVVVQHKFDTTDWLRLVDKYKVTATFSAPTPIRMICNVDPELWTQFDVSTMRVMMANAAPWSMALKEQYLAHFPAESLFEIYGSTELGVNCVLEPHDQLRKPGSCGQPAPFVEIVLFDDEGMVVDGIGPEHPGELYVRSSATFTTYYKADEKYEADRRGDFHTVGDIAYRDDEGYIYICDRKKDMIISGGVNIYPAEIEAALELHPRVFDVAVFGIPDENWGEAVHAIIVAKPLGSITAEDVMSYAREHLAGYKVPRSISFLDELPRTGSGKILKRELRAPFWVGQSRMVG